MEWGKIIREARKSKSFTQDDLAQRVGVTKATIYSWEKGRFTPTDANNISALEEALGFENGHLYKLFYQNPITPRPQKPGKPQKQTA